MLFFFEVDVDVATDVNIVVGDGLEFDVDAVIMMNL